MSQYAKKVFVYAKTKKNLDKAMKKAKAECPWGDLYIVQTNGIWVFKK